MYVNPFWFGVLVTLVVEIVAMIVFALVKFGGKDDERKEDESKPREK